MLSQSLLSSPASVPGFLLWQGLQQRGTGVDYHLDGLPLEQHLQGHGFHGHPEHAHREMNTRVCMVQSEVGVKNYGGVTSQMIL